MLNRLTAAVLTAALLVFGFAAPAAAAMPANAPRHYVSLWEGIGYTGAAYPISDDWTGCRAIPSYMNDRAMSVANNTASPARNVRFFQHGGCTGASYLFYAGTYDGQLSSGQGARSWSSYRFGA